MTALEDKLNRYKEPSSPTEQDKQDRAERMVRNAALDWSGFDQITLGFFPKGSYANNTNVRTDSDVDIAVLHEGLYYHDSSALKPSDKSDGAVTGFHYPGLAFRRELEKAMNDAFGSACDTTGKTAIEVAENSGRVKADVVPSFHFRKYFYDEQGKLTYHQGHKVFRTDGTTVVNYPQQQLDNGRAKNTRTRRRYKYLVRILKRLENDLVAAGKMDELPSYFMECLVYCVPDGHFNHQGETPLTDDLKAVLGYIWNRTDTGGEAQKWFEPNGIKQLFSTGQPWTMADARDLTAKAWSHLKLS
ncbi:nucleotidyltransferase [Actinomadura decatromicini]|uniref:Nucleotidyltransferase n=1 Tax=Actinomadura decatromicini TaxID=2604572 RepID=A0A5D3F9P9_9ACTN|nr:nucleotidyltransferase [Actinomadura decatromicini]TYK44566.1 nucleotidyltransferase [Actinomadura decatromicini]